MSNNTDESTWKSYDKFYNKLKTGKDSMDIFEAGLKCFSSYLCHASQDYVYNSTYLPGFTEEFRIFIEAFSIKYKVVTRLFQVAGDCPNVTLKIDRYWLFETDENKKSKKTTLSGTDFVSKNTLTIECSVLYNMQRYIYHAKYEMDKLESNEVVSDFRAFLQKYMSNVTKGTNE